MIRPSSLPMLSQCAQFESGSSDFAELGTDRHSALEAHMKGDDGELLLLDDDSQAGIRWAANYILMNANSLYVNEWEVKQSFTAPNFETIDGTPDLCCGPEIFDFKWRYRDYTAQMAAYAAMRMENFPFHSITVHLLFGESRRSQKLIFDRQSVEAILTPIFNQLESNPDPAPCDYCGWCARRLVCKALTGPAATVGVDYAEPGTLDIQSWRPSEMMESAADLAFALKLWRTTLKKWGASVEFHAMEAATKRGLKLPGFELKPKKGKKFVSDTNAAYVASGLPPEEFLKSCEVRLNTSKKYPDRQGLDLIFKNFYSEPTVAAANRTAARKLGDLIQQRNDTLKLVATKGDEDEEESDSDTQ